MLRMALVITVIHTFYRFAVNTDRPAGMLQRTGVRIIFLLRKALTACIVATVRMFAAHHDIALAAALFFVVGTTVYATF